MMNRLLIIGLLIGMVSCTKEVIIYNEVDNNDEVTYTEGRVNVYLQSMDAVTRSAWEYDDYFPSPHIQDNKHERGFYNRLLVSFDSDFLLEYYSLPQVGINNSFVPPAIDNITGENDIYTYVALGLGSTPVTTGAHYFYVLCNLPQTLNETFLKWLGNNKGVLTKDEFEQTLVKYPLDSLARNFIGDIYPIKGVHEYQRCMMTNMVSPAPDYMASKDQNSNEFYPSTNDVSSYIGRIFAKASLAYVEDDASQKLSEVYYRVVNVPNSVYLMSNIFDEQIESPHYELDFINNYETLYDEWFDAKYKLEVPDDSDLWQNAIVKKDQEKTYVYCMENGNKIPLQGNSTFLLVKGKYTPEANEWIDKNGSSSTPNSNGTFWRVKRNGYYTTGYYNEKPDASEIGTGQAYEYLEGITYYPIWLQTRDRYQVQRNGFYKIAVTEVRSAGAPTPATAIDPLAPLEITNRSSSTKSGDIHSPEIITNIQWQQGGF